MIALNTCSFVLDSFRNWEPAKFLSERCTVFMAWHSENKACSSTLDFLHRLGVPMRRESAVV